MRRFELREEQNLSRAKLFTRDFVQTTACRRRDAGRPTPPAQNRTCASTHTASTSDEWRRSAAWDKDVEHGVGESWKVPRRIIRPVINAKKRSTWFNHELLVGVK